jgi:hypothetical protein
MSLPAAGAGLRFEGALPDFRRGEEFPAAGTRNRKDRCLVDFHVLMYTEET